MGRTSVCVPQSLTKAILYEPPGGFPFAFLVDFLGGNKLWVLFFDKMSPADLKLFSTNLACILSKSEVKLVFRPDNVEQIRMKNREEVHKGCIGQGFAKRPQMS